MGKYTQLARGSSFKKTVILRYNYYAIASIDFFPEMSILH